MRLFIALDVPERVRQQVLQVQQTLGQMTDVQLYPEPYSNLHMTLAFLGEQPDENIVPIRTAINMAEEEVGSISDILLSGPNEYRELDKLGMLVFSDNGKGQAFWSALNKHLLDVIGYTPQFSPWLPHITLVRFGERPNLQPTLHEWESFHPQTAHIYRSEKVPSGGARYVVVASTGVVEEPVALEYGDYFPGEPKRFSIYEEGAISDHPYFKDHPGLVAFVDVFIESDAVNIGYVTVEPQHRGRGFARELMQYLYDTYPNEAIIWGERMEDEIDHLWEKFREVYPHRTARNMAERHSSSTIMYHGTDPENRESILQNGLDWTQRAEREWMNDDEAEQFPYGNYLWYGLGNHADQDTSWNDIWEVNIDGLDIIPDPAPGYEQNAAYVVERIPPERLRLIRPAIRTAAAPQVMYHMSPGFNRESILEHGLNFEKSDPRNHLYNGDQGEGEEWPRGQYLFVEEHEATDHASSEDDIWEVNVEGLNVLPDPYLDMDNSHAVYTTDPIPSERIRLHIPARHIPTPWWEREANIFDPIQKELDQKVFTKITPKPTTLKFIHDNLKKMIDRAYPDYDLMEFIDLYLTGSLTTYQYDETSDADISVFVQWDMLPPDIRRRDIVALMVDKVDGTILPGTEHPLQHFIVGRDILPTDLFKKGLRSAFSFRDNEWVNPPERERVHDVANELPILYNRAQMMAEKMELLLNLNPIYAKEFWHQIHRKRQKDQQAGLGDFSEGNIVYKYLLHNGYFDRIRSELGEVIAKTSANQKMYHNADPKDRESIMRQGLDWTKGALKTYYEETDPNGNFLHRTPEFAWEDAARSSHDLSDMWAVDVRGLDLTPDPEWPEEQFYTTDPIGPERLQLLREYVAKVGAGETYWHVAPQEHREAIRANGMPVGTYLFIEEDQADEWWDDQHHGLDEPSDIWQITGPVATEQNEGWITTKVSTEPIRPEQLSFIGEPRIAKVGWTDQSETFKIPQLVIDRAIQTMECIHCGSNMSKENGTVWCGNCGWEPAHYQEPNDPHPGEEMDREAGYGQLRQWGDLHEDGWRCKCGAGPWANAGLFEQHIQSVHEKSAAAKTAVDKEPPEFSHWNLETDVSIQVIYDYEGDRIILLDHNKESKTWPAGQIIGEYTNEDVILNDHHEAWLSPSYFQKLWYHSFPDRPLRSLFIESNGEHHHIPIRATLLDHGQAEQEPIDSQDQEGLARERSQGRQEEQEGTELLQVDSAWKIAMPEMFGNYMWPTVQEIQETGAYAVQESGQEHQGWYDHAEGALDAARGAAINRHVGVFGSGGTDDPIELASHLIWRIQDTQAAIDGNKRTGVSTGLAWLDQHGYDIGGIPQDDSLYLAVNAAAQMGPDEGAAVIDQYLRQYVVEEQEDGQ